MKVQVYTDGSCLGNPGPGAWAYLIKVRGEEFRAQGGEAHTTNNRMELLAAIRALHFLKEHYPAVELIEVFSDSSWVVNTINDHWKRKKNLDLWKELEPYLSERVRWQWVKGHAGHPENEDCNARAQAEATQQLMLNSTGRFRAAPDDVQGSEATLF